MKRHFNKNLVMRAEDERRFQSNYKCWIWNKLFVAEDNKVRDHCHIQENLEVLANGVVILLFN